MRHLETAVRHAETSRAAPSRFLQPWWLVGLIAWVALALPATSRAAEADWNDAGIAWRDLDAGLAEAKSADKPVCLVFFTTWCPHCHNYSRVFADPQVVKLAKSFVMVRLDKDKHAAASKKYAIDGEYIPRTLFLDAKGELLAHVTAPRPDFRFFYDEKNPASLLGGMRAALATKK